MTEIQFTSKKNLVKGNSHTPANFISKVVLLIGNDAGVLHSLAVSFASKGSDIALASSRLPVDIANTIRESVQALGGRFLLLDNSLSENRNAEMVVGTVKKEMGGLDILIDMSAKSKGVSGEKNQGSSPPRWWLSKAILQEIRN